MRWDEAQEFPSEVFRKLGELGFLGVLFPEEYGGAALSYMDYAAIVEEISCVDPSIALSLAAHNSLGSNHLFQFGTEAQQQEWIEAMLTVLTDAGFTGSERVIAQRTIVGFLLGYLQNEHYASLIGPGTVQRRHSDSLSTLSDVKLGSAFGHP